MRRGDDSTNAGRLGRRGLPHGGPPSQDVAYIFTRDAIRELDRLAVEEFGIPSIVLMENAAIGLAGGAAEFLDGPVGPGDAAGGGDGAGSGGSGGVLVVAGRGNNGGDGLAAARHLHNEGRRVAIVLAAPPETYTGDAAVNLRIATAMGLPIHVAGPDSARDAIDAAMAELEGADVVIDALLGTGATGRITGVYADLIAAINDLGRDGAAVVAADLPSGLDADTGDPLGEGGDPAVRADLTVTFVGLKEGFLTLGAQEYLGDIVVAPIGAPTALTIRLGRAVPASEYPGEEAEGHGRAGAPGEPDEGVPRPDRGGRGGRGKRGGGSGGGGGGRGRPPRGPRTQ